MISSLSKKEAEDTFNDLRQRGIDNVQTDVRFVRLREDLISEFSKSWQSEESASESLYVRDLHFALRLYEILGNKCSFTERDAAQDGIWRYISLRIIPDIVYARWGEFQESRFFKEPRRMWLKALWWYIHLSWQGSADRTFLVLKDNTTDDVVQIVERPGNKGYRIDLYREVMRYYGQLDGLERTRKNQLFRKVMKLNTARTKIIEPSLTEGGNEQYVKELFGYFDKNSD